MQLRLQQTVIVGTPSIKTGPLWVFSTMFQAPFLPNFLPQIGQGRPIIFSTAFCLSDFIFLGVCLKTLTPPGYTLICNPGALGRFVVIFNTFH
jgi:hypothetical protein